jgi:hypothetical protein
MDIEPVYGSYRDPSGFVFRQRGVVYRALQPVYRRQYEHLMASGLARDLQDKNLLIRHSEVSLPAFARQPFYKIIQPEHIPFISYPWEWTFHELKDAALLTLEIQRTALEYGMILTDANALNIQFLRGRPVLIDTLSFDFYQEGTPWVAYRQFCEHFLAPLSLMAYVDENLGILTSLQGGAVPLEECLHLLGGRGFFNMGIFIHLRMQGMVQRRALRSSRHQAPPRGRMRKESMLGLIMSLEQPIKKLSPKRRNSAWHSYYDTCPTGSDYLERKKELVAALIKEVDPKDIWDIGANRGTFSKLAGAGGRPVIAFDADRAAIDALYLEVKNSRQENLLPLVMDVANPTSGTGWMNKEYSPFLERGHCELCLALALVHHLAIGRNLPFPKIVELFAGCCRWLIIEFVQKDDQTIRTMLQGRADIFDDYTEQKFEEAFGRSFDVVKRANVALSTRTLYLMRRKNR